MEALYLIIFVIYAIVFGFFCLWLAVEKGRNEGAWFSLGFLFGVFALLALGLAPSLKRPISTPEVEEAQPTQVTEEVKQCPYCMETIKLHARKCRYCSTEFSKLELAEHLAVAVEKARKLEIEENSKRRELEFQERNRPRKQRLAESGEGLCLAIVASDVAQVEEMLSLGADPNARFYYGELVLLRAIQKGNLRIVTALINAGAKVSSTRGLLHAAVRAGSEDIVKLLLVNGANIDEKNLFGPTALQLAEKIQPKNDEVIWALKTAPLRFKCPKCETLFEVAQEFRGKQGTCRSCNTRVQVPKKLS